MYALSLEGQVGIVTGAGSEIGIGRSLVLAAAKAGAKAVYACDLRLDTISSLQLDVRKVSPDCVVEGHVLDVASEDGTVTLLRHILKIHKRFDFFFANAGYANYRSLDSLTTAQFGRAISVMQQGVFLAIKYGSRAMSVTSDAKPQSKGAIVVTSSSGAFSGSLTDIGYSAVKSACHGLVINGSVQLSTSSIRINAIAPGLTKSSIHTNSMKAEEGLSSDLTEMSLDRIERDARSFFEKGGLLGSNAAYYYNRIAEPEEIAHLGVFLASDLAAAVNGAVILADSGYIPAGRGAGLFGPIPPVQPLDF